MNKEEKEAIDYFKECILKDTVYEEDLTINFMKKAVNLIEKQQAEIEELKDGYNRIFKNNVALRDELDNKDKIIKYNKGENDKAFTYQNKIIRSMAEFMFHNYYGMTYVDEWQFEEKIQEIIGDFERKIEQ